MHGSVPQLRCHSRQKEVRTSPIFFGLWWHHKLSLNISPTRSSQKETAFLQLTQQLLWTKPPTQGNCYRRSHQWNLSGTICFGNSPNHAILIPFPQNSCTKTLMLSSLQSPTSSTLHWLLVLYHQASKLLLSTPCSNNPPWKRKEKRREKRGGGWHKSMNVQQPTQT